MRRMVVDLETVAIDNAADYLDLPTAPANYKSEEAIAKYVSEKHAENLSRCALDENLCRIVAIGVQLEGVSTRVMLSSEPTESHALRWFWDQAEGRQIIGFNFSGFDAFVLLRRSLLLGIEYPKWKLSKYRHEPIVDLLQELTFDWQRPMRSLRFFAKRFGIPLPEDSIDGSGIAQAVADGNWSAVENHVYSDVQLTAALAERMGLFKTAVSFPPSGGEGSLVGSTSPSVSPALLVESEPLAPQSPETVGQSGQ